MSFALLIKKEILSKEFSRDEALSLLDGLISVSGVTEMQETIIKISNVDISNSIKDFLDQLEIPYDNTFENKNWIVIEEWKFLEGIKFPANYFAGVFLGGGSISSLDSTSYHLELQMYSHAIAEKIQNFLNKYDFKFLLIQRRKLWVLYIKKSGQIADFLKAIQTIVALLEFEDSLIIRGFKNEIIKYSNLEVHNQKRLAESFIDFKKQYLFIKDKNMTSLFREEEIKFYELKLKNPYKSLVELVIIYNKTSEIKTKSGLSHYLIKLRRITNDAE